MVYSVFFFGPFSVEFAFLAMLVVDAGKDFEKNNPQPVGQLKRMGRAKGKKVPTRPTFLVL